MNSIQLTGRLGRDPEARSTNGGVPVCTFSIGVDRFASGKKLTDWFRIVTWDKLAEACKNLVKGALVGVTGELTTRQWETKDNAKQTVTEVRALRVDFLSPKPASATGGNTAASDDEIPF